MLWGLGARSHRCTRSAEPAMAALPSSSCLSKENDASWFFKSPIAGREKKDAVIATLLQTWVSGAAGYFQEV